MKTQIIEKLKEKINNGHRGFYMPKEIAKEILQALEEQPVKDEKCEHVTPICYNPDAFCYRSECDQADSCIHHSGRKEKK
ncbi:MAG: hypothetical protein H8E34_10995 [Bacteroidetes bacterium]|nr:hypothetical protein [Bacteroidota bacterium]